VDTDGSVRKTKKWDLYKKTQKSGIKKEQKKTTAL